jgi:ATP-dependent Clp protease, protease subunit
MFPLKTEFRKNLILRHKSVKRLGDDSSDSVARLTDIPPGSRICLFFGGIDDETAQDLCDQLITLDAISHDPILLIISGPGGDLEPTASIIQIMKLIKSPVHTFALGHIASGCSYLFIAGELGYRFLPTWATVMLHNPQVSIDLEALPNLEQSAKWVNLQERLLLEMVLPKGLSITGYKQMLKDSWDCLFVAGKEAIDLGFADHIVNEFEFSPYLDKKLLLKASGLGTIESPTTAEATLPTEVVLPEVAARPRRRKTT